MNLKQKLGCSFAVIRILVTQPIWYYLLYSILKYVEASELMWFLYWVYLPVGIVLVLVEAIVSSAFDKEEN